MDQRLKRKSDFDKVFSKGKKCYGRSLKMLYINSDSLKIGFSVSKKHGNAVVRNRIKRLLRAAVRERLPYIKNNYFIVFLPKIQEFYEFDEYKSDISFLLKKEKLIDDNK